MGDFERDYPLLAWLDERGLGEVPALADAVRRSRAFRRAHIDPAALAVEREAARDPAFVARDVVGAAARYGWFTMMVPRLFGGQGLPLGVMMIALEEVSAGCLGLANLIAVHGLALSTVGATGDVRGMARVCRRLAASERDGEPALLSTAITEPGAGTDMEDARLLRTARLVSEARPVRGGYLLSGRKVFISNGSIAETHVVVMPTDRSRPVETMAVFLVDRGAKGLSIGRVERKMGQKACPAAELVFEDCFVPDTDRLRGSSVATRVLDLTLGATRGGVGVFGAGVARGAYERALSWAQDHRIAGRPALEHAWVRATLVEMRRNVMIARAAYLEAMLSNDLYGLGSVLRPGLIERAVRHVPDGWLDGPMVRRLVEDRRVTKGLVRRIAEMPEAEVGVAAALGAHAKVTGSDLGVRNSELALEIAGADGLRHDAGLEKLLRDAKLLQIYEGTNQLNRIEIGQRLVTEVPHG